MGGLSQELRRLLAPVADVLVSALGWLHWWLAALLLAYLGSGITRVQPDEVALVYRLGRLTGGAGAGAVHEPGLLLTLPRPIDRVVRVPVATVFETDLRELHHTEADDEVTRYLVTSRDRLDPERTGYVLTGDQNIVHIAMVARWQISDPVAWVTGVGDPEDQLRQAVLSAAVTTVGGLTVDHVLSDGRQGLIETVQRRAQQRLDDWHVGVSLVSLELIDLSPPQQVASSFREVQTAAIDKETRIEAAREYREVQLPRARSERLRATRQAEAEANARVTTAEAEAGAFLALATEAARDRTVVRERLYREGIETVLRDAGQVDFVPPPSPGTRITVRPSPRRRSE